MLREVAGASLVITFVFSLCLGAAVAVVGWLSFNRPIHSQFPIAVLGSVSVAICGWQYLHMFSQARVGQSLVNWPIRQARRDVIIIATVPIITSTLFALTYAWISRDAADTSDRIETSCM